MNADSEILSTMAKDPQFLAGALRYSGIFRGFAADVVDPEQRGRIRVRVPAVHGDTTPVFHLPWAERCFFGGGGPNYGDFIPLKGESSQGVMDGDGVWIMFEGGDPSLPVILGTWPSNPNHVSELPDEIKRGSKDGQFRRTIYKTRHGHRIEMGDDPNQQEIKLTTARGDIFHMRESDGGRGIHVQTAEGHRFSMQDEQGGESSSPVVVRGYDDVEDKRYNTDGRVDVIAFPSSAGASGTVQSLTSPTPSGFGQKGILLETAGGHKVELRDVSNPGVTVTSAMGHEIEISDTESAISLTTIGGNIGRLQDGYGLIFTSEWGQSFFFESLGFGVRWPSHNMYFRFGGGLSEWHIDGSMSITATGDITIQAGGTLTEQGATRIEIPPVPSTLWS